MSSKTKTSATKEEARPALVPKLRFLEFREAGDWTTKTLGSVAKISTEKAGDNTCIPMSITSGVGLVSQMEKFGRIIAGSSYANYLLLKKSGFAYNKSATKECPEGFIALYSGDELAAVPNSIFTCFRIKGESPVPQYLNYLFLCNLHGKWLRKFIEVGARAHGSLSINEGDLLALPVPLPSGETSVPEQQKIAECLSSVDELMAAQARKVEALKTHKKGLMQQIFPREGESQPRLRFPEFQNAGEWELHLLSKLTTKISDGIHATPIYDEDGKYAFINGNNLVNGRILIDEKTKRVNFVEFNKHKKPLDDNSILMSINGTIGNLALYNNEQVILGKSACFINIDERLVNKYFIYSLLQTEGVKKFFNTELTGSTIKNLSLTTIKNLELKAPSLPEQQRIADCLTSLEDLLAAQTQKLEALKTHKKGLMQQLFPSPEQENTL